MNNKFHLLLPLLILTTSSIKPMEISEERNITKRKSSEISKEASDYAFITTDEKEITLTPEVIQWSKMLQSVIEDLKSATTEERMIPLMATSKTIDLLSKLANAIQGKINQETDPIITQNLQAFVNEQLKNESAANLLSLLKLTHFLEMPDWFENAVASTFITKVRKEEIVPEKIPFYTYSLPWGWAPEKEKDFEIWLNNLGLAPTTNELLKKHWRLQLFRREEWSIKDLLATRDEDYKERLVDKSGTLDLSERLLTSLDGLQDIPNIEKVKDINLRSNYLETPPHNIFKNLIFLERLDLSNNKLSSLPDDIFNGLNSLKYLHLNINQFTELPANIFKGLPALQFLDLHSNLLTELPAGIFDGLTNLSSLYIQYNNYLKALPAGIFKDLNSLKNINYDKFPPEEMEKIKKTLRELMKFNQKSK